MKKLLPFFLLLPLLASGAGYPSASYGNLGSVASNTVAGPGPFTFSSSDWSSIVVSGAGTAAANGTYTQVSSNLVAGLPYAVWSNTVSAANAWRLVMNNTNFVPATLFSNLWTLENTINVNYAYDLAGPSLPAGTWEVSGLGGTPGVSPPPQVGTKIPPLIVASGQIPGGVLTLSPGFYDLAGYVWYPTNLTVVAYGATITGINGVEGIHPFGSFQMYGGSYSNGAFIGAGTGSLCVKMDNSTNYVSFFGSKLFGATDTLGGTINSDNFTLSLNGCELGDNWDVVTFGKAAGLSNVVFTAVGTKFYSVTNGISSSSALINPGANQVRIAGCYLEQGLGFTTGAGLITSTANTTNELNGCVVVMRNNLPKVKQSSGVLIVDGVPYASSDMAGTLNFAADNYGPTNLYPIGFNPDFRLPFGLFVTNNVVVFQPCTNVDAAKIFYQRQTAFVTNTTPASPRAIIPPTNSRTNGVNFVTNLTRVDFEQYGQKYTNFYFMPLY